MRSYNADRQFAHAPALYDKWFIALIVSIILFGLMMMTSASIVVSYKLHHQPFYFLYKQLILLAIGFSIAAVLLKIPTQFWERFGGYLLLLVMLMLGLVLIPGIGHSVNGSMRWLGVGALGFQVSELTKFTIVIFMAGYLYRRNAEIQVDWSGFIKPMTILAIIAILLLKEPDFGATVVVTSTSLGMMYLAGMRLRHFIILFSSVIVLLAIIAFSAPYRIARLTGFLNPWARAYDTGYQLTQSLIAFGRGGWFGMGLGKSIQKQFYLPEAHTDFLFAIIAEELGVIGMTCVLALFFLLVWRIFYIGKQAQLLQRHFAGFLAYGFGIWIAIQFIVSIGVNTGLLPTKGLTLPFMSYGGSSILVNCMVIALIIRIDYENRLAALGIEI